MLTKTVRDRTEMNAEAVLEKARDAAKGLAHQQFVSTFSWMDAYENVGKSVGRSGSWVRQFIKGYYDSTPNLVVGMNLIALYESTCRRIEKSAERLENETAARNSSLGQSVDKE